MSLLVRPLALASLAIALVLAGCSSKSTSTGGSRAKSMFNSKGESLAGFAGTGSPYLRGSGPVPRGGGKYLVGKPYQVAGRWYHPKEQPGYDKQGAASWYGEAFHRRKTSNGEYFDMNMLSAAHPTLPLPSYAKVTNLENGKSVIVRINDRGPFVGNRIIDLSKQSADVLGFRNRGNADVRIQWIGPAPLNDKGSHLAMMNRKLNAGSSTKLLATATSKDAVTKQRTKKRPSQQAEALPVKNLTGHMVRVGTFGNPANAQAVLEQVSELGPARIVELGEDSSRTFAVLLGPMSSREEADQLLRSLSQQGFPDAILTRPKWVVAEQEPLL